MLWFTSYWFSVGGGEGEPVNKAVDRQCIPGALPDTPARTCNLPALSEWAVKQGSVCD